MKPDEVKKLLEKYYEGQTSLAEEELLHDYFRQNEVPAVLREEAVFFWFTQQHKVESGPNVRSGFVGKSAF